MSSTLSRKHPTIGCCGIDCGLCPRYYTDGSSRCPGCVGPYFYEKHPSCSIVTCCMQKNNKETCAQCKSFPCMKISNWDTADSFVTHRNCLTNLRTIKKQGMVKFIKQQHRRMKLLASLIEEFEDGRSRSFFCLSTSLLPLDELEASVAEAKRQTAKSTDEKLMAKSLRETFKAIAEENGIELLYRKAKA